MGGKWRHKRLGAPSYTVAIERVADTPGTEAAWNSLFMLGVMLEHQYTQDGLTIDNLKGIDRLRASVLFEAAGQAGCMAHLALITLWAVGSVDHYPGENRRYGYRNNDDTEAPDEYEMGNVHEFSQIIDKNKCDIAYCTEQRGRPYTLICTKTTASYDRVHKIFERDSKGLARLVWIEEEVLQ